jgi:hypothetical protein
MATVNTVLGPALPMPEPRAGPQFVHWIELMGRE